MHDAYHLVGEGTEPSDQIQKPPESPPTGKKKTCGDIFRRKKGLVSVGGPEDGVMG